MGFVEVLTGLQGTLFGGGAAKGCLVAEVPFPGRDAPLS